MNGNIKTGNNRRKAFKSKLADELYRGYHNGRGIKKGKYLNILHRSHIRHAECRIYPHP